MSTSQCLIADAQICEPMKVIPNIVHCSYSVHDSEPIDGKKWITGVMVVSHAVYSEVREGVGFYWNLSP